MKKRVLLLCLAILSINTIYCQEVKILDNNDDGTILADSTLNKLIDRYFILFNTGQESGSISSFAGIDIGKTEVSFTPTFFIKKNNVLNLKFKGGITEGVSSVFKNNKFNTNISIEAQYNIKIKSPKIKYNYYLDDFNDQEKNLINQRIVNLQSLSKFVEVNKKTIELINSSIYTEITSEITKITENASIRIVNNNTNGLNENLEKKTNEIIDSLKSKIKSNDTLTESLLKKELEIGNIYAKKYKEENKKLKLTAIHHKWISIAGKVRNDAFKTINRENTFENQITDETYVTYGGSFFYNNYDYSQNDNSTFYSVGISYENKSNFSLLDDVDINNITPIGNNGDSTREVNEKYTAYEGSYIKYIDQIEIIADYYYFFNRKNVIGLHLYEKSSFNKVIKPNYNVGAGLVFSFKNKEKESIINTELYYTFKDIASNNTEINALESNEIGLRFVLPLNFNFNL